MAFPSLGGGYQLTDGNVNELRSITVPAPQTATTTATLTAAQVTGGILLGSPGASAASYTLPTVALLEASLVNPKVDNGFDWSVVNVNGATSGVITVLVGTGWTIVGKATMELAASAGSTGTFRARKTGDGTWTLYRIA